MGRKAGVAAAGTLWLKDCAWRREHNKQKLNGKKKKLSTLAHTKYFKTRPHRPFRVAFLKTVHPHRNNRKRLHLMFVCRHTAHTWSCGTDWLQWRTQVFFCSLMDTTYTFLCFSCYTKEQVNILTHWQLINYTCCTWDVNQITFLGARLLRFSPWLLASL